MQNLNLDLPFIEPVEFQSDAVISADGQYRYLLSRQWAVAGKTVAFICLNPSTADASKDDPTVRKCIRFAKSWGGGKLLIVNLFAYRSTDPLRLKEALDPIGPENDAWLDRISSEADILVGAWGVHGILRDRNAEIMSRLHHKISFLRLTKDGHPSHPLYLPESLTPVLFSKAES